MLAHVYAQMDRVTMALSSAVVGHVEPVRPGQRDVREFMLAEMELKENSIAGVIDWHTTSLDFITIVLPTVCHDQFVGLPVGDMIHIEIATIRFMSCYYPKSRFDLYCTPSQTT